MNAARGHTQDTAEGHALFLNPKRERNGSVDQPTNENESDGESQGIVTKRKARGATTLCHGSRIAGFRSAWALARQTDIRVYDSPSNRITESFENIFSPKTREKVMRYDFLN